MNSQTSFATQRQMEAEPRTSLPLEMIERGKREREFFDHYTDPDKISDELLRVTPRLEQIDLPSEVLALAPHLRGKRTCEFGCGYGLYSAYFALKGAEAFCFDISESNIRVAQRTARINKVESRMHAEIMQAEGTLYPGNYFDFVFGNAVLHHLELSLAAREIFRILKPGGVAIFLDPLGENKLLEWVRNCPLRASNHRHTPDERPLLYTDLAVLHSVFSEMRYREMALLTVIKALFRKAEAGMIAIPRGEQILKFLGRVDDWLLGHAPMIRPLASYLLVCLPKPVAVDSSDSSDLGSILQLHSNALRESHD